MQETLQLRALLAPASHLAWTGMVAWALWRIGAETRRRFAVTGLVVAFAAAVGLHYLWDQTDQLTPHVVIAVISVAILMTLMVLSARRARTMGPVSVAGLQPVPVFRTPPTAVTALPASESQKLGWPSAA